MASSKFEIGVKRKRITKEAEGRKSTKNSHIEYVKPNSSTDVKQLEDSISDSQQNFNDIAILLKLAKREVRVSNNNTPALLALCRIFCRLHARGWLSKSSTDSKNARLVAVWLKARYTEYREILLGLLSKPNPASQEVALALALELVREECTSVDHSETVWRSGFYSQLLKAVLCLQEQDPVLVYFIDHYICQYKDLRHYTLQAIGETVNIEDRRDDPVHIANALAILSRIPSIPDDELESPNLFVRHGKCPSIITHKKQAQKAWMTVLTSKLNEEQRKTVLGYMTYRVLPWFQNIELLMDFLIDSFNYGGAMSLLALSGMFHLMQEKNLDYPDFYTKLYSLLDNELLSSKHRSRFFRLFNTFMSSTHLPAALVASFIKKLSRLSLYSPPGGIVAVIPWIYNTLKAHPSCTFMIHREPQTDEERQRLENEGMQDPFDPDERDPVRTNAIDSSLWELYTLQSHYHPNVASLTKIISEQFTKGSYQIEDFLDHSYKSLLESELSRDLKKAPVVEHEVPKKVFKQTMVDEFSEILLDSLGE